jgi:hypothetical protein
MIHWGLEPSPLITKGAKDFLSEIICLLVRYGSIRFEDRRWLHLRDSAKYYEIRGSQRIVVILTNGVNFYYSYTTPDF